jgi:membrane protein required for colicin V production
LSLVDVLILAILVLFLVKGVVRGLLKEVCSLLGLVLGGVFAFSFHLPLARALRDWLPEQIAVWGSFLAIFLLVTLLFALLGFLLHRFVKVVFLGGMNRLTGALFGLVQGVILLAMLVLALNSPVSPKQARWMLQDSQLAPPFVELGHSIYTGGCAWLER